MFVITERELYHYGVKGMKWGVRKDRKGSGRTVLKTTLKVLSPVGYAVGKAGYKAGRKVATRKNANTAINVYRNTTGSKRSSTMSYYRRSDVGRMSNEEIRNAIDRMQLEQKYRSLTEVDFKRGRNKAQNVLSTARKVKTANI